MILDKHDGAVLALFSLTLIADEEAITTLASVGMLTIYGLSRTAILWLRYVNERRRDAKSRVHPHDDAA